MGLSDSGELTVMLLCWVDRTQFRQIENDNGAVPV